jgi:hypothetical protein
MACFQPEWFPPCDALTLPLPWLVVSGCATRKWRDDLAAPSRTTTRPLGCAMTRPIPLESDDSYAQRKRCWHPRRACAK